MPKISVYVSKELHQQLVEQGVPITRVCQAALAQTAATNQNISTGTRLRGLAQSIIEMSEMVDARIEGCLRLLQQQGVDTSSLVDALPWLRGFSGGTGAGLASVDGDGAVEGADTG